MRKFELALVGVALAGPLFCSPVLADEGRHEGRHDRRWHGDIRAFHEHDMGHWRGGRWFHGPHAGRLGWWWIVGGVWYFYAAPVYPYPDPYLPPVVVQQAPPVYVEQPVPVNPPPPPRAEPVPTQYWYYCRKPEGYYPYVPECKRPWEKVPATPVR